MDRDNITRIGARASRVEELISSNGGALPSRLFGHSAGHKALATECTNGRCKPRVVWSMFGATLIYAIRGKALPDSLQTPAFQPYWGKPAVRNDRGDGGNGGIIRSPISRHRPTRQHQIAPVEKSGAGGGNRTIRAYSFYVTYCKHTNARTAEPAVCPPPMYKIMYNEIGRFSVRSQDASISELPDYEQKT